MEQISTDDGICYQLTTSYVYEAVNVSLTMSHDSLCGTSFKGDEYLEDEKYVDTTKLS